MASPWLSILIPCYNVAPYVEECLDSIFKQATGEIEIIVIDDCSTDDTYALLQQKSKQSPVTMHVVKNHNNQGISVTRNKLIEEAQGVYVWYVDPDDIVHEGAIQQLKSITLEHAPDLILCDFKVWRANEKIKHRLRGENHKKSFFGKENSLLTNPESLFKGLCIAQQFHVWSKISKRELWDEQLRFPAGQVMEDVSLTPLLAMRAKSYYYHPQTWISYRQREGSILSTFNPKKIEDMSIASRGILNKWLEKYPNLSSSSIFAFQYFCIKLHIVICRDLRKINKNPDLTLYRKRLFENIQTTPQQLYWQYIKRGWFLRLIRFLREA